MDWDELLEANAALDLQREAAARRYRRRKPGQQ